MADSEATSSGWGEAPARREPRGGRRARRERPAEPSAAEDAPPPAMDGKVNDSGDNDEPPVPKKPASGWGDTDGKTDNDDFKPAAAAVGRRNRGGESKEAAGSSAR